MTSGFPHLLAPPPLRKIWSSPPSDASGLHRPPMRAICNQLHRPVFFFAHPSLPRAPPTTLAPCSMARYATARPLTYDSLPLFFLRPSIPAAPFHNRAVLSRPCPPAPTLAASNFLVAPPNRLPPSPLIPSVLFSLTSFSQTTLISE